MFVELGAATSAQQRPAPRQGCERRVCPLVFEAILAISPERDTGDAELAAKLGRLRFLRLAHLGVAAPDADTVDAPEAGAEWAVATLELRAVARCTSRPERKSGSSGFPDKK